MLYEAALMIDYGQIIVFKQGLPRPGLLWSDDHVAQGFAWAPGIVSFGVPDPEKECLLRVDRVGAIAVEPEALLALRVPFDVSQAPLKIGTVTAPQDVAVPAGTYDLVFKILPGQKIEEREYSYILKLDFVPNARPDYEILKQGPGMSTDKVLRKDADYA